MLFLYDMMTPKSKTEKKKEENVRKRTPRKTTTRESHDQKDGHGTRHQTTKNNCSIFVEL